MRVFDFDEVVETPIVFKMHGQIRQILPVKLEQWSAYVNKFAAMMTDGEQKSTTIDESAQKWFEFFSNFITPITLDDIKQCSLAQIAMCFSAVMRRIQGESSASIADSTEIETDDLKKKLKQSLNRSL